MEFHLTERTGWRIENLEKTEHLGTDILSGISKDLIHTSGVMSTWHGWIWRIACLLLQFELPGCRPALIRKLKPQQCDTLLAFTITALSAGLINTALSFWLMQLPDLQTSLAYIQLAQTSSYCMHHSAQTLLFSCSSQVSQRFLQQLYTDTE